MATNPANRPVAVIAGVGPGNGYALARHFSKAGYVVAMLARDSARLAPLVAQIPDSRAFTCDVGDAKAVAAAFEAIRADLGEIDALIYNAGSAVFADVEAITPEQFEAAWRVNALGALLCAKKVMS